MRAHLFALLLLAPASALWAQEFDLGVMKRGAASHVAPAGLRGHLAAEMKPDLDRCIAEKEWGLTRGEDFFAAVQLSLGKPADLTYLVFPSTFCPAFFGASSVPYWIVSAESGGTYRTIRSGATHRVRVLRTRTHGFRDIEELYGEEPSVFRYNGRDYREGR